MTTKRHLVMLAFMALALGVSFSAGWAGNSNCNPADCAAVCDAVCVEKCEASCPPECIVICEEICAGEGVSARECASACAMETNSSGTLAGIDPAGQLSFRLSSGNSAEIVK